MKASIKRVDPTLPLPEYQTKGSVAFDLMSRVKMVIQPQQVALIPLNIIVKTPKGFAFIISSRSSLPRKKGLLTPSDIGIIDQDYCGDKDEVLAQVFNFTSKKVIVERGERVAQGMFIPLERVEWQEKRGSLSRSSRGGFGSTRGYKQSKKI